MSPRRITLRVAHWLAYWSGTLGAWSWQLEFHATRNDPPCPDCGQSEVLCFCAAVAEDKRRERLIGESW